MWSQGFWKAAAERAISTFAQTEAALLVASFVILWLGAANIVAIAVGIIVLDMGVQGIQVTNQALIYAIDPTKRSRINSAYMVCFFAGASLGSLGAGLAYAHWGWSGTCAYGLLLSVSTLVPVLRPTKAPMSVAA